MTTNDVSDERACIATTLLAMPTEAAVTLGVWSDNADRLVPRGQVTWAAGPLGFAGSIGITPVAAVRKSGHRWLGRIEGWQWHVTEDMGVARLNDIPGDKIKTTPVKDFRTAAKAKQEIEAILGAGS